MRCRRDVKFVYITRNSVKHSPLLSQTSSSSLLSPSPLTHFADCLSGLPQDQCVCQEHGEHGLHCIGPHCIHSQRYLDQLVSNLLSVLGTCGFKRKKEKSRVGEEEEREDEEKGVLRSAFYAQYAVLQHNRAWGCQSSAGD